MPRYPLGNEHVEETNKITIDGIKKCLDLKKDHLADELGGALWSHTTLRGETNKIMFSLAYVSKAMTHYDVNVSCLRRSKIPLTLNSTMK